MKKIVAIVLAMVMVLGLSTVAFADTTTSTLKGTDGYEIYNVTDNTAPVVTKTDISKVETGNVTVTEAGKTTVTYTATTYTVAGVATFAEVDSSLAEAKLVNKDGVIVAYLKTVTAAPTATKVATAFVEAKKTAEQVCGDNKVNGYVIDGKTYVAGGDKWAVLNGKFVAYTETVVETVAHTYAVDTYTTAGKVATLKCPACKAVFTVLSEDAVKTMAPAAYKMVADTAGASYYIAVATASAPAAGDKVESAQTFDAGIAMYVGMSVMAAAGSAVVLKKKD